MIISTPTIYGCGRITGAFPNPARTVVAVASTFPLLTNPPGRAAYAGQQLRHRLGLYRRGERRPFATFDQLRFPINDVSFHPEDPVIAIGGGSYDGGWMFEGELILWDWSTGSHHYGVKQVPEVERCAFDASGTCLDVLVHPWDEEWGADESPHDAFERLYPLRISYDRDETAEIELDPHMQVERGQAQPREVEGDQIERQLAEWFAVDRLIHRGAIWDVAWLDSGQVASVHDDCLVETYNLAEASVTKLEGEGYGAAILRTSPRIVQVASHDPERWDRPQTTLLALRDGKTEHVATFEGAYNFVSSTGQKVLGRLDRHRAGAGTGDVVIDLAERASRFGDLGHYDCFNHFIGIEGAPDFYLLQGTPPTSHEKKRVCRLRENGKVETLWPLLQPASGHADHAMECRGCYIEDDASPGLIVSGRHYDPAPSNPVRGFIYRKPIAADQETWRHGTAAAASAVTYIAALGLVAAAFLDGSMLLLDGRSGRIIVKGRVTAMGVPTVIYSMDACGSTLAVGTFDGQIAVISLEALISDPPQIGSFELSWSRGPALCRTTLAPPQLNRSWCATGGHRTFFCEL